MAQRKKVSITRFGVFSAKESKEKKQRNPQTKEIMISPAKWRPKFAASPTVLKKWVETGVKPVRTTSKTEESTNTTNT